MPCAIKFVRGGWGLGGTPKQTHVYIATPTYMFMYMYVNLCKAIKTQTLGSAIACYDIVHLLHLDALVIGSSPATAKD